MTSLNSVDEDALRRFETAWPSGQPHSVEHYLPPTDDPRYPATLEELVHIELEFAYRFRDRRASDAGARVHLPRVEGYLARFPSLNQPPIVLRLLRQEYQVRQRHGDHPS